MGWGNFLDQLFKKLPICDRKERWKNQIDNLTKERDALLKKPATIKSAARVAVINRELDRLNQLCKNAVD